MCVLGKRLLKDIHISNCTKNATGPLYELFCPNKTCDPYFQSHNISIVQGIKVKFYWIIGNNKKNEKCDNYNYLYLFQGLSSGVFFDNLQDSFLQLGEYIAYGKDPEDIEQMERPTYNQVYADLSTTFTILIGIFFPSVTGNLSFEYLLWKIKQ